MKMKTLVVNLSDKEFSALCKFCNAALTTPEDFTRALLLKFLYDPEKFYYALYPKE